MRKLQPVLLLALAIAIIVAIGVLILDKPDSALPKDLARYYPANTSFYLELEPGEALSRRFVTLLSQQMELRQQAALKPRTSQTTAPATSAPTSPAAAKNSGPAQKPPATDQKTAPAASTQPQTEPEFRFRQRFLANFGQTFSPFFSLGIWPNAQAPTDSSRSEALVILPLKDDWTIQELMGRFDIAPSEFERRFSRKTVSTDGKTLDFWVENDGGTAVTVLDQNMMLANSEAAMQTALRHYLSNAPGVLAHPLNVRYLERLSRNREGTFILNNSVYASDIADNAPRSEKIRQVARILPVTVGGIQADSDSLLSIRFLTPIVTDHISDNLLRQQITELMNASTSLQAARELPESTPFFATIAGLDVFYDLYRSQMATPQETRFLQGLDMMLSGLDMDLRKDIIHLLSRRTVLSASPETGRLVVMVQKTPEKLKTLEQFTSAIEQKKLAVPARAETIAENPVQTIMVPGRAQASLVSFGALNSAILIANRQDYRQIVETQQGDIQNLSQSELYKALSSRLPGTGSLMIYLDLSQQPARNFKGDAMQPGGLEGLSLAVWTRPQQKDNTRLLEGRLNLKLAPETARPAANPAEN